MQPFPDLKGQAPLRHLVHRDLRGTHILFLTSKVRLHCDMHRNSGPGRGPTPFPDLKGQAPLRRADITADHGAAASLFLTSKVRLHCDLPTPTAYLGSCGAFS